MISDFLQFFFYPISVNHFKSEEDAENGKIFHEFVCFDIKNIRLKNIFSAKMLAKKMGEKVFPFLDKLLKNTHDKTLLAKYEKTRSWVHKKTVIHPHLVEYCTHKLLKKMKNTPLLNEIPLTYSEIYTDTSIAAILHDIGRLSEVDIIQGCTCMKRSGLNKNNAEISFDILQTAHIKPEILLAIRCHEFADVAEAHENEIFKKMTKQEQSITDFYIRVLQDMDKTANLTERSIYGIKQCAEIFDPHYIQDYNITEEYFIQAISGNYLNIKGGHLLDAMMRFVTWTYSIHFKETKELLAKVLTDYFKQIYQEAWREFENSDDKDNHRLANTLEKIMQLEDYAIIQKMNMKINTINREKVINKLKKLK